jgi:hypothetical protein
MRAKARAKETRKKQEQKISLKNEGKKQEQKIS